MSNDLDTTGSPSTGTEEAARGLSRRRAVLAGAGAVGATVVLAACGTDTQEPAAAPTGGAPAATGGAPAATGDATAGGAALAKKADVPVGGGVILADQKLVITQPVEGTFKAFSSLCTHKQCPVSKVDAGNIVCTCHNSQFSVEDGSVKGGPATAPLEEKQVKVDGDNIVAA